MKRIAHVYSIPGGGIQRYVEALSRGLEDSFGEEIQCAHLVADPSGKFESAFRDTDFAFVFPGPYRKLLEHRMQDDCSISHHESYFVQLLERVQPDLVHFHDLSLLGASLIGVAQDKGIRTVVTLHDHWFICPRFFLVRSDLSQCDGPNEGTRCRICFGDNSGIQPYTKARYDFLHRMLTKKTDRVIAVSNYIKQTMEREGIPPEKIQLVYTSVINSLADSLPKTDPRAGKPLQVGYIGAVSPHKGVHVLLQATCSIADEDVHVHVYGTIDSLYLSTLNRLTADRSHIILHGTYTPQDLSSIFDNLDVLVVPSVCQDLSPLVIQEAYSHGVPVIGSQIGGIPEYIREDCGQLFEAGNSQELSEILKSMIRNPDILTRWRNHIPKLDTIRDMAAKVMNIYGELLDQPREKRQQVDSTHLELLQKQDRGFLRGPYLRYQMDEIYRYMKEHQIARTAVFGTGALGRQAAERIREQGVEILAFIDNDSRKHGTSVDDIAIFGPAFLRDANAGDVQAVVVASDWEADIRRQLDEMNVTLPVLGIYGFDSKDYA